MNNSLLIALASLALIPLTLQGQGENREWRGRDGRALMASGVAATLDGVIVSRSDGKPVLLPYEKLAAEDAVWAIQNLELRVNQDVRLVAKSVKQQFDKFERETGNYALSVDLFRTGKNTYEGTGSLTAIMEKVKESGRVVEVTLSSLSGKGMTAVEFYTVKGEGNSKSLSKPTGGVYEFAAMGSALLFPTGVSETYGGWVVLTRNLTTGEVSGASASMTHLIDFVKAQVPESIDFELDGEGLKKFLLDRAGGEEKSDAP